jgi:hypothetical protein
MSNKPDIEKDPVRLRVPLGICVRVERCFAREGDEYKSTPIRRTERPWRSDIALKSRPVVPSAIILKGALMGARGEARRGGRSETSRHGVCRRSYGRRRA